MALLVAHAMAGIPSYMFDLIRPFSESKNAASFMLSDKETREYLFAECGAASISAYLGRKVYYLKRQNYGSFCKFNRSVKLTPVDEKQLKNDAVEFIKRTHRPAFLVTNKPLTLSIVDSTYIKRVGAFERGVLRYENYYVYRVSMNGGS
jgi:hypothetical protein